MRLGRRLLESGVDTDIVVGLPRGGVVVAAEVAHIVHRPLDVLIVRKIGHPLHREFAVGALAEAGVVILDDESIARNPVVRGQLDEVIREETARLGEYQSKFQHGPHNFHGRKILLVDDGIATGATTEAAALSARKQGASTIVVAVPVASSTAVQRLKQVADEVRALLIDPQFDAVGRYYRHFPQTSDDEVLYLLNAEHATP